MKEFLIKLGLSVLAVFAPIKAVMLTAGVLIVADLILGVIAAHKRGEKITSAGLRRTIAKMAIYEAAIMLGFLAEKYLIGEEIAIVKIIAGLVGIVELKSILESLDEINGSPIFKTLLDKLKSKNDETL